MFFKCFPWKDNIFKSVINIFLPTFEHRLQIIHLLTSYELIQNPYNYDTGFVIRFHFNGVTEN